MPNRDHSHDFWRDVASTFGSRSNVIFDIFNEPHPGDFNTRDGEAAWRCWRDGGSCPGVGYQAAGMQELVDTVRSTGARNVIVLSGVWFGNALNRWLEFMPHDPLGQLVAAWHVYDFGPCNTVACFDTTIAPVAAVVPLVATEIGETDCTSRFIDALMQWLDGRELGYLGWAWVVIVDPASPCGHPTLVADYEGTPTPLYGRSLRDHMTLVTDSGALEGVAVRSSTDPVAGVTVSAGGRSRTTRTGRYRLGLRVGEYVATASAPGRVCHAGGPTGPQSVNVTIRRGATTRVDWFCVSS